MAIQLKVFLKRTGQSLSDWLNQHDVTDIASLKERSAFVGLAVTASDEQDVALLLAEKAKKNLVVTAPVVASSDDDVVDMTMPVAKKRQKKNEP